MNRLSIVLNIPVLIMNWNKSGHNYAADCSHTAANCSHDRRMRNTRNKEQKKNAYTDVVNFSDRSSRSNDVLGYITQPEAKHILLPHKTLFLCHVRFVNAKQKLRIFHKSVPLAKHNKYYLVYFTFKTMLCNNISYVSFSE